MSEPLFYLKASDGQVSVYDDRVVIDRQGFTAKVSRGPAGQQTIPIDSILTVQYKPLTFATSGYLQFGTANDPPVRNVMERGKSQNCVLLRHKDVSQMAEEIKNYIEQRIAERSSGNDSNNVNAQTSVADELAKLRALLDNGTLTQEEFDAQKKKLLEQ